MSLSLVEIIRLISFGIGFAGLSKKGYLSIKPNSVVELTNGKSGFLFLGLLEAKIGREKRWPGKALTLLSFRVCLAVQSWAAEA
jgi:hypothetical protein